LGKKYYNLKGQSHEIDQAYFKSIGSSLPNFEPLMVLNFKRCTLFYIQINTVPAALPKACLYAIPFIFRWQICYWAYYSGVNVL